MSVRKITNYYKSADKNNAQQLSDNSVPNNLLTEENLTNNGASQPAVVDNVSLNEFSIKSQYFSMLLCHRFAKFAFNSC